VIQAEGPDADENLALGGHRVGQLADREYLRAAVFGDDDGFHAQTFLE